MRGKHPRIQVPTYYPDSGPLCYVRLHMARLVTIDLDIDDSIFTEWNAVGLHIPFDIFDIFTKHFCPQAKAKFGRVTIRLCEHSGFFEGVDTCVINERFVFREYRALASDDQNRLILDIIVNALKSHASKLAIRPDLVENAAARIRHDNYCWFGPIGKPKSAKNLAGVKAGLSLRFCQKAVVTLGISFPENEGRSVTLLSQEVNENYWLVSTCLQFHSLTWDSEDRIFVYQDNARDYWSYSLQESKLEFHYPPAEQGDAHGEFALGQIYLAGRMVPKDTNKGLELIERSAEQGYKHAIRFLQRRKERQETESGH